MRESYIDTNVFIRFLTKSSGETHEESRQIFQSIYEGKLLVHLNESIFTEICYVLASKKLPYRLTHQEIAETLIDLLQLQGIIVTNKKLYVQALTLYATYPDLDIEDALLIAYAEAQHTSIITFDKRIDNVMSAIRPKQKSEALS